MVMQCAPSRYLQSYSPEKLPCCSFDNLDLANGVLMMSWGKYQVRSFDFYDCRDIIEMECLLRQRRRSIETERMPAFLLLVFLSEDWRTRSHNGSDHWRDRRLCSGLVFAMLSLSMIEVLGLIVAVPLGAIVLRHHLGLVSLSHQEKTATHQTKG